MTEEGVIQIQENSEVINKGASGSQVLSLSEKNAGRKVNKDGATKHKVKVAEIAHDQSIEQFGKALNRLRETRGGSSISS